MLQEAEHRRAIYGVRICRTAPSLSHLFFADDTLIFARATDMESGTIRGILDTYGHASGQLINYVKSAVFFSANTPAGVRNSICTKLGIRRDAALGNYLGLPADIDRSKRSVFLCQRPASGKN